MPNPDDIIELAGAIAAVYDPPEAGLPHLAVILVDGQSIACEAVDSVEEGEALLRELMRKLPQILEEARQEDGEAALQELQGRKRH